MKILLSLLLLVSVHYSFAQRTNENDSPVTYKNPVLEDEEKEVFLNLNMEWFVKDSDTKICGFVSKDEKVEIVIIPKIVDYKEAVKILNNKKNIQWEILPAKKIIKYREEYREDEDGQLIALAYGVPMASDVDKIITMMVFMLKTDLPEWESYFDKVAETVGVTMR